MFCAASSIVKQPKTSTNKTSDEVRIRNGGQRNRRSQLKSKLKGSTELPLLEKCNYYLKMVPDLSTMLRLYIYGLHGYLIEITFTAIFDFVLTLDWKLKGCTSIWSFFIYGTCGLFLESTSKYFRRNSTGLLFRAIVYLLIIYAWEFSSGAFLSLFNACPWDYSHYKYNLCGLITFEYAPFWIILGLGSEKIFDSMNESM